VPLVPPELPEPLDPPVLPEPDPLDPPEFAAPEPLELPGPALLDPPLSVPLVLPAEPP
jgi:hypothetical protein